MTTLTMHTRRTLFCGTCILFYLSTDSSIDVERFHLIKHSLFEMVACFDTWLFTEVM